MKDKSLNLEITNLLTQHCKVDGNSKWFKMQMNWLQATSKQLQWRPTAVKIEKPIPFGLIVENWVVNCHQM